MKVIDQLISEIRESETFDMGCYFHDDKPPSFDDTEKHPCGTPACIAGHLMHMFDIDETYRVENYEFSEEHFVAEKLGISREEADVLCMADVGIMFSDISQDAAVRALEHIRDHNHFPGWRHFL